MKKESIRLNWVSRLTLVAAACGASFAAHAQQGPNGPDPITVQAEHLTRAAARERANGFVRVTGVASGETPAARWVDAICPDVTGLVESAERVAEARIRRIATAIGARVAPEGCERNLVISFASDGAALARQIDQLQPRRLAQLTPTARSEVLNGSAPIRWWYTTEVRGRHGAQNNGGSGGMSDNNPGPDGAAAGEIPGGGGLMHYESSIVSTLTNRVITSAIVIVDQNAVMGRRLDTLADYAALVALAEIRSIGATSEGSILNTFAAPDSVRNLTPQDMAFLRALYRMPLDRQANMHRGVLVSQMADALSGSN